MSISVYVTDSWTGKPRSTTMEALWAERALSTPYRFDEKACAEPEVMDAHMDAGHRAIENGWPLSIVPTVQEAAAARSAGYAWNPPERYQGD